MCVNKLQEAHETLYDDDKRRVYDAKYWVPATRLWKDPGKNSVPLGEQRRDDGEISGRETG